MLNLFIDTNIFLNLYSFSKDDLKKWYTLLEYIKGKKIKLYLTAQIQDEFKRNREIKLNATLKSLREYKPTLEQPVLCQEMTLMKEIQKLISILLEKKLVLISQIDNDIQNKNLDADKLTNEIFTESEIITTTDDIISKAQKRKLLGNPPGKGDSICDAVNWECLLENIPNETDLYLISFDTDYSSPIDNNKLSQFLNDEWISRKSSNIILYRLLSSFFKENFPEIGVTEKEIEKEAETYENYYVYNGKRYINDKTGISIRYPDNCSVYESVLRNHNGEGFSIIFPDSLIEGTNLSMDSFISVERLSKGTNWSSKNIIEALNFSSHTELIGDTIFDVSTGSEGTMGNIYQEIVSLATIGEYTYCLRLFLHSHNLGAYDPGTVKKFDYEIFLSTYTSIRKSFKIISKKEPRNI